MIKINDEIKACIEKINTSIIFVHTDIRKGFNVPFTGVKSEFLSKHIDQLLDFNCDLFLPVFNYDFAKTKSFDVLNDNSQVGVLNEFFRKKYANWQTPIPFFSVCGIGEIPEYSFSDYINLFDESSIWSHLYKKSSIIMYYGASFSSTTIIHFVEKISNKLFYRYEKQFDGHVILPNNEKIKICVNMHVRPLGHYLDYDWLKLENDLYENKILFKFKDGLTDIKIINVRSLVDFWIQRLNENKLYFLDKKSILWVKPLLERIDRPFQKFDFE